MSKFIKKVRKFFTGKEEGASLVEYALLVALIAVVCIAGIRLLGSNINTKFSTIATEING